MSSFGWIAVAGVFGFLVITFFKVFPMYYGNYKVISVLESLQQDSEIYSKSKRAIWDSLNKRLYINEVRNIQRENVKMVRKDGKTTVTITYRIEDEFIGNLFIGGNFAESIVIDR
jgi:hypothetical protein